MSTTTPFHTARFQEPLPGGQVLCTLCPHDCRIAEGRRGACSVRYNHHGRLVTLVYDRVVSQHVEAIEKKPLFHFLPGSRALSIATVGCNLRCSFCQNWELSQWPRDHLPARLIEPTHGEPAAPICPDLAVRPPRSGEVPGMPATPQSLVQTALESGVQSIAYTFTEPTIFYELAYDTAVLARRAGLRNVWVSNGFTHEAPIRELCRTLDGINIDLKFFDDRSYQKISKARLQPVLDAIRLYHDLGVWVEVTTLVIPGVNDSDDELSGVARFLAEVDPGIPWHISRFFPAWKMQSASPTPRETLLRAREIGRRAGLHHVYVGNIADAELENTACPRCSATLVERRGFTLLSNRVEEGHCPDCGVALGGRWSADQSAPTTSSAARS